MVSPMHILWCKSLMMNLRDGGIWGIPRSGLTFTKHGDTLVLTELEPHSSHVPWSAAELRKYQEAEYKDMKEHFEAAGFEVTRLV